MAIALVVLMGMVAMSVDLGNLTVAAQRAQGVADAAALGAANQSLADQPAALVRIGDIISANNAAGGHQVTWQSSEVYFYAPGETVPGWGQLDSNSRAVKVFTHTDLKYYFAPMLGVNGATVTRKATALRRERGGFLPCVFAHGTPYSVYKNIVYNGADQIFHHSDIWSNCDITMNGSGQTIEASAHADRDFTINGSNQTITGRAEYVRNWRLNGSNQNVNPVQVTSSVKPYPVNYTAADFTYDYDVPSLTFNGSKKKVPPGVYRVHGNVVVNGSQWDLTDVTFVADGDIIINGSQHGPAICKAPNFVLFLSLNGNITVNGAYGEWRGTIFAPNGTVTFNGSNQTMKNGSLMGEQITVNGSGWHIYGSPDPSGGTAEVMLIQ